MNISDMIKQGADLTQIINDLADFTPMLSVTMPDASNHVECIFCHAYWRGDVGHTLEHFDSCLWARAIEARDDLTVMQIELLGELLSS